MCWWFGVCVCVCVRVMEWDEMSVGDRWGCYVVFRRGGPWGLPTGKNYTPERTRLGSVAGFNPPECNGEPPPGVRAFLITLNPAPGKFKHNTLITPHYTFTHSKPSPPSDTTNQSHSKHLFNTSHTDNSNTLYKHHSYTQTNILNYHSLTTTHTHTHTIHRRLHIHLLPLTYYSI